MTIEEPFNILPLEVGARHACSRAGARALLLRTHAAPTLALQGIVCLWSQTCFASPLPSHLAGAQQGRQPGPGHAERPHRGGAGGGGLRAAPPRAAPRGGAGPQGVRARALPCPPISPPACPPARQPASRRRWCRCMRPRFARPRRPCVQRSCTGSCKRRAARVSRPRCRRRPILLSAQPHCSSVPIHQCTNLTPRTTHVIAARPQSVP